MLRRGFRHQTPPWMKVTDDGVVACTPGAADHPQLRFETGQLLLDPCRDALTRWPRRVETTGADGVLMLFGSSGMARQFDDGWHLPCDPTYESWFQPSLEANLRAVQAGGARVWVTLAPYNRHASVTADLRAETDQQTDCLNQMYKDAAAHVGGIAVIDLHSLVCPSADCATEIDNIELRPDGLHFAGAGGDLIARWLLLQLGHRRRAGSRAPGPGRIDVIRQVRPVRLQGSCPVSPRPRRCRAPGRRARGLRPGEPSGPLLRQLVKERVQLAVVPADPGDLDDFVQRYRDLEKVAPLAIDEQWQTVTDLIVAVATEDLSDPATADRLRDRAVAATKAVDEVRLYAQHTCGVDRSSR